MRVRNNFPLQPLNHRLDRVCRSIMTTSQNGRLPRARYYYSCQCLTAKLKNERMFFILSFLKRAVTYIDSRVVLEVVAESSTGLGAENTTASLRKANSTDDSPVSVFLNTSPFSYTFYITRGEYDKCKTVNASLFRE